MAPFALTICLMFIAFLVVSDCRRRKSVSNAVWIPTFLLLIIGSRPVSMWLGAGMPATGMGNEAERDPIDQLFFFLILASALLITLARHVKWGKFLRANGPILVLYGFFLISILWSGDPMGSFKRLVKDFGMLAVIAVMFSEKEPLEAMRAVYVRCAFVLFPLSVVCIKYFPSIARSFAIAGDPMYTGVTTQKNTLGEIVLVFTLFLLWDYLETTKASKKSLILRIPWDRLLLLAMGLYLINVSQSKTALLCLIIGAALVLRGGWFASKMFSRAVLLFALSVPFLLFFAQRFKTILAPLVEAMGRSMTFTGRTDIWDQVTANTVNPWIGAGYWNFWGGRGGMAISEAMHTPVPNAHSGYVDMYIDGGIVGLCVLLFVLVACGRRIIAKIGQGRYQRMRFAILIVMIFYNLSESMYVRLSPIWFTTLMMLVEYPGLKSTVTKAAKTVRVRGGQILSPASGGALDSPVRVV